VPAGIRQLLIRLVLLSGTNFEATLADDRALESFVRQSVFGVWHPVGTCRMGDPADRMALSIPTGR
jgi:5-(hydroxymethyl)furfural/furfural oxidase